MFVLEENVLSHISREEKAVSGFKVFNGLHTFLFCGNARDVKSKTL
jgi:hypothetical protein